jgi:hypothetical protein
MRKRSLLRRRRWQPLHYCAPLRLQKHRSVQLQTLQTIHYPHQMYSYIVHKIRVLHPSLLLSLSMSLLPLLLLFQSMAQLLFQTLLSQQIS